MNGNVQMAKQQLMEDFGKVVSDTEELLKAVKNAPGEQAAQVRASIEARLVDAKARLQGLKDAAVEKTTDAARAADTYVHENPWPLIGAAAIFGFFLGLVVRDHD